MARDPYKYFRVEARELLDQLSRGVLDLEKGEASGELVGLLLRLAHTLKGAARVVKQPAIADHAHHLEELLEPVRGGGTAGRKTVDAALARLDAIAKGVAALASDEPEAADGAPAPAVAAPAPAPAPPANDEASGLLDAIAETQVQLSLVRRDAAAAEQLRGLGELLVAELGAPRGRRPNDGAAATARSLADEMKDAGTKVADAMTRGLELVERELAQVREAAELLKLRPASTLFTALERTARDAARSLGSSVVFETHGGDVRLDAGLLAVVQQALVQVVRNAVAHGIEPEAVRRAAGKATEGRISLEVRRRGARVAFVCRDDGRGVDVSAVRRAAERRGLGAGLDADALIALLLRGGLTTSGTVTEVSGRGVGLDVVREAARRLGGDVSMRTEDGRGTTVELVVPVNVSALDTLVVGAGARRVGIPLEAVVRVLRVRPDEIARTGQAASVVFDGEALPFAPLDRLLDVADAPPVARTWSVVVVDGGSGRAAVGVDRLYGSQSVVVRQLPRLALAARVAAGASLDAEGNPRVVLDPAELVARAMRAAVTEPRASASRLPILVIDDSLTTRMLEQSILESAGYDVELAASAEEGLDRARAKRHALFLVDVEMPGMDGFAFIERTRADAALRETPAVLVTSRSSPEDRQRGVDVGASGYVVKTEFDQTRLLERIRELVG